MGDSQWKERKAALEEVITIIQAAHLRIQPNLSRFWPYQLIFNLISYRP